MTHVLKTSSQHREPTEADIQKQAYHLWIDGGCLEGVELDNWLAAKELLKHRHGRTHGHAVRGSHAVATGQKGAAANREIP